MKRHSFQTGFTLVELLTVIAAVAVLAGLLITAVGRAKGRALRIQCVNNLRQHGIALSGFVATHGEYPLFMNTATDRFPDHRNWLVALFPEQVADAAARNDFTSGVFDCPAARHPESFPPGQGFSDYGYNSDGVIGRPADRPLGLGGRGSEGSHGPPVSESAVKNPSDMIAIGDGFLGWQGIIQDGSMKAGPRISAQNVEDSTKRARARHSGKANWVYCDGHVESLGLDFLFQEMSDAALKKWNIDNEPHRERLQK